MKYKGFLIEPVYMVGADFRILADDRIVARKPTSKNISHYSVIDPLESPRQAWGEDSIADCKKSIDELLKKIGMRSNALSEWQKLD